MIQISNLSIHFGGHYLFDNISFAVNDNDRIGLIGRNGTGKSTILKILYGIESPEDGNIVKPNIFKIGYLPQEGNIFSEKTVFEEASSALDEIQKIDELIPQITKELSERIDYDSREYHDLLHTLTDANDRYRILGGHSIEADIEQILTGLGFSREDFDRLVPEFSGGWQMRLELAKILLSKPDCILLDEPTNHLDIESIRWLEQYLKNYPGSIILVSHDKRFLDNITNRTIEIANSKIYDLNLAYSEFVLQRDIQRDQQMSAFKNQQRKIAQTERFIERFRSKATLATRVQSRIKQLDKIERIEVEDDDTSSIHFKFPEPPRSGRIVVEAHKLSKSYGYKQILNNVNFTLERGEKVAFVGKNGEGKTTLTKIMAGFEDYTGELKIGLNVLMGYYAQHQAEMLDGDTTVFETIDNAATGEMRTQVRSLLGAFLFSGDSIYKKVKVLSGGEKSRLALAKLLLLPSNLLVFDEPTNHLDMIAKDVLKDALLRYSGSLIIVSHDRDFLKGLTTKTIEFKHNKLLEYPGDIDEFLEKQEISSLKQLESNQKAVAAYNEEFPKPESSVKTARENQKVYQREENKIKKQIRESEDDIDKLEKRINELEILFSDPDFFSNVENMKEKQAEYNNLRTELAFKVEEWELLILQLEEYQSSKELS